MARKPRFKTIPNIDGLSGRHFSLLSANAKTIHVSPRYSTRGKAIAEARRFKAIVRSAALPVVEMVKPKYRPERKKPKPASRAAIPPFLRPYLSHD